VSVKRSLAAALVLCLAPLPGSGATEDEPVRITIDQPRQGEVVRGRFDMAPLSGLATAGKRATRFDVILVIDVSGSTEYPSGLDVNENGELGVARAATLADEPDTKNTDPGDSILAAQVQASRALLGGLEPGRVRVGLVSFSGEIDPATGRRRSRDQVDAMVEQPLTGDYQAVDRALEAVKLRGPHGGTNMEAGIKIALRELAGLSGARSKPRKHSKKVILLLTDGKPSLPFGLGSEEDQEDIEAVISAAHLAKAGGVMINVFGLGPSAIDYPIAASEAARVTGGLYTPVRRPGDIVALLTGVSFANVEDVVAVNLTIAEMAGPEDILTSPDGSFKGYVPVRQGKNRIRVSALASDGSRGSTEIEFVFRHQELTDAEMNSELTRIRKRNRELQLLMEQERQKAFRKSIKERDLEIQVEDQEED
jgi:Mg-chelatase subunit ChlD